MNGSLRSIVVLAVAIAATPALLAPAPAMGQSPSPGDFTATVVDNQVTVSWDFPCSGYGCLLYIYGPSYDGDGASLGDVGLTFGPTGSESFRVPHGGIYTYTFSIPDGGQNHHVRVPVEVEAPAVPQPAANPVYVDKMTTDELAPGATAATLSWTHPGSGYVQVRGPGESWANATEGPANGSRALTAEELVELRGSAWGPYHHTFLLRYCESLGNVPLCSDVARVRLIEGGDHFEVERVLVEPGEDATVSWAGGGGSFWFVSSQSLDLSEVTVQPSLTIPSASLTPGQHQLELATCRFVTYPTDVDCTNIERVKAPASGSVVSVVDIEGLDNGQLPAESLVATLDTTGDGTGDLEVQNRELGTIEPGDLRVEPDDAVTAGDVLADFRTSVDGIAKGNLSRTILVVADHPTWTETTWDQAFTFDPEEIVPLWKHRSDGHPLDVTVSSSGDVWGIGEFSSSIFGAGPGGHRSIEVPLHRSWGTNGARLERVRPFLNAGGNPTSLSIWGEGAIVGGDGLVYAVQGGNGYQAGPRNHSRVVRYDPSVADAPDTYDDDGMCMVNLPGGGNAAGGLAWDATRDRLWVTEIQASGGTTAVSSFAADELGCENHLDYEDPVAVENSAHQYCDDGETTGCITKHEFVDAGGSPLFDSIYRIKVDEDGVVWFSDYWGTALGRFDPSSGEVRRYEPPSSSGNWNNISRLVTDDEYVYVLKPFLSDLLRFEKSRWDDPSCAQSGACFDVLHLPTLADERTHSLALDGDRLWFTRAGFGPGGPAFFPGSGAGLPEGGGFGYVDLAAWAAGEPTGVIYRGMDGLAGPGRAGILGSAHFAGIAIDPTDGSIVLVEFHNKEILRLHPQE